ncbi:MAG TPA: glycosyltransferase family A protein [Thermoanaerobaculaceae bacterium]|nr:glycosyltransferase family A protein [Thermoanaerobaculaceae bacterium]
MVSGAPLVSVLMTAYNRERYIAAAIESVLAQSMPDFELVVVDDCSSDGTVAVAQGYTRDPRVRVVRNERNLGDYPNRNRASALARGEFLKYHDSDDLMYPHCLATMLWPLRAEPRAGFALTASRAWAGGPCPMLLTPRMCYQREYLGFGMFNGGPANALFRSAVFRDLGGLPNEGICSDVIFWHRACRTTSVLLVPGDLFWYRVHPGQEIHRPVYERDVAAAAAESWRALSAPGCPLTPEEREAARRNWVYGLAKAVYYDLTGGQWALARFRLAAAGLTWGDWLRYLRRPHRTMTEGTPLDERGEPSTPDWRVFNP